MNGKGSTPRKRQVTRAAYEDNWDRIFGKRVEHETDEATAEHGNGETDSDPSDLPTETGGSLAGE